MIKFCTPHLFVILFCVITLFSDQIFAATETKTDYDALVQQIDDAESMEEVVIVVVDAVKDNPDEVLRIVSVSVNTAPLTYAADIAAAVAKLFPNRAQDISNAAAREKIDAASAIAAAVAKVIGKDVEEILVLKPFVALKIIPPEPELESVSSPR